MPFLYNDDYDYGGDDDDDDDNEEQIWTLAHSYVARA